MAKNFDARYREIAQRQRDRVAGGCDRAGALLALGRILGVRVERLAGLTEEDWWEVECAISAGNLHGEELPDVVLSDLTEEQLQRMVDGERPSIVVREAA